MPPGNRRWLLLALAFLAVIAVSVAATVWFTQRGSGSQGGSGAGGSQASADGEIASAGDTGPVGIITEDPTCERWVDMRDQIAMQLVEWGKRDASIPAAAWTLEQRQTYETAGRVLTAEAEQIVQLARQTPHRVMRELYEQLIAYNRAYADAIATYTQRDDDLVAVSNSVSRTLTDICSAIKNLSAAGRGPSVPTVAPPGVIAPIGDLENPKRFLTSPSDACPAVKALAEKESVQLAAWFKTDPNVPGSQRNPADQVLSDLAMAILGRGAEQAEQIGRSSGNPVMEDFLVLAAQYYRAFVSAIPTQTGADAVLYDAAQKSRISVVAACDVVDG